MCGALHWVDALQISFRPQKEISAKLGDGQTAHSPFSRHYGISKLVGQFLIMQFCFYFSVVIIIIVAAIGILVAALLTARLIFLERKLVKLVYNNY